MVTKTNKRASSVKNFVFTDKVRDNLDSEITKLAKEYNKMVSAFVASILHIANVLSVSIKAYIKQIKLDNRIVNQIADLKINKTKQIAEKAALSRKKK